MGQFLFVLGYFLLGFWLFLSESSPARRSPAIPPNIQQVRPTPTTIQAGGAVLGEVRRFKVSLRCYSLAVAPNRRIAAASESLGPIHIWDFATSRTVHVVGPGSGYNNVAFAPDGRRLLSGGGDENVYIWDVDSGEELLRWRGHRHDIQCVAFSPDGKRVLTGTLDRGARIWDPDLGGSPSEPGVEDSTRIRYASFSPDGRSYAAAGNWVQLHDTATGKLLNESPPHAALKGPFAFSPDGTKLAAYSWERRILSAWDLTNNEVTDLRDSVEFQVKQVQFHPNGLYLLALGNDHVLRAFDMETGDVRWRVREPDQEFLDFVLFPDGRQLLTTGADQTWRLWELTYPADLRRIRGHRMRVTAAAATPDGRALLTASWDNSARLCDRQTGKEALRLEGHARGINGLAISPDSRQAVTASRDHTSRVWDLGSGEELLRFEGHTQPVHSVAWSADGRSILSSAGGLRVQNRKIVPVDCTLRVWEPETGREVARVEGHTDAILQAMPAKRQAVTASADGTLRHWDLETGEELARLQGHERAVNGVALTPDARRVVSAGDDRTIRLWDLDTGEVIREIRGHTDRVTSVAVTPDGSHIVSSSGDCTVRVWSLETGKQVLQLTGHTDEVLAVTISTDGRHIVSASADPSERLWEMPRR